MDANNFKNVFKNMFLNQKRDKDLKDSVNPNLNKTNTENQSESHNVSNKNPKKYVKYSDIIDGKIKENKKKEEIPKKFNIIEDSQKDVIQRVAEMQKHKKQFEEDNKKSSFVNESKKPKEDIIRQENQEKFNLDLVEKLNEENSLGDKSEKKPACNINVYSSDSEPEDTENDKYSENIASIPKEFELEVCNREWVVDVDPKK